MSRLLARIALAIVVGVGGLASFTPAAVASCDVNVGTCDGGTCTVNAGTCEGNCLVNARGTCGKDADCVVNTGGCSTDAGVHEIGCVVLDTGDCD
jgi:hypothetical protein